MGILCLAPQAVRCAGIASSSDTNSNWASEATNCTRLRNIPKALCVAA